MIVYAVFSLVSFWTVEWLGRRKLFLIGTIGQMVSMIITFGCLIPGTKQAGNGAALGIFLSVFNLRNRKSGFLTFKQLHCLLWRHIPYSSLVVRCRDQSAPQPR